MAFTSMRRGGGINGKISGVLVYKKYVRIPDHKRIVSYLTPLSGIRKNDYDHNQSAPLNQVTQELRQILPKNATLVGQKVESDIEWMQLVKGSDFRNSIDLSEIFCGLNQRFGNISYHSLIHEGNVILGANINSANEHDPAKDARISVQLWNKAVGNPQMIPIWQDQLIRTRPQPSPAKLYNGNIEGVCISKFQRHMCRCGMP